MIHNFGVLIYYLFYIPIQWYIAWYSTVCTSLFLQTNRTFFQSCTFLEVLNSSRAIKLAAILCSISHWIECINVNTLIYHDIWYIDMIKFVLILRNYQMVVIIQWYCSYNPVPFFDVWLLWDRSIHMYTYFSGLLYNMNWTHRLDLHYLKLNLLCI